MRVVFPLPTLRPQSQWPGKEVAASPAPPLELKVSIPLAALRKASSTVSIRAEGGGEVSEHRHHKHKHKKHKKKKSFVSPSQTSYHGSVGHHAFEQAHPQLDAPSKPQSYSLPPVKLSSLPPVKLTSLPPVKLTSLPPVKLSSLPPKQFYDHHTHKHKDKHHHKRQHSGHEHSTMTHSSQSVPPIPSLLHHAPPASPSLPPHTTQHSPLKHTTPHEGKHTHHKKKKKHRHSKSEHHTLPQVAPPHGEPHAHVRPTSPAPNSETKTEGDHADGHPEGFPPSSKRARISDPSVLPGKPLPTPTPQHPVLPVQPPQWTNPKADPESSAVQLTDTLLPQTNLEAHLESAVALLQPPPLQSSTAIGPSLLNPPPHRPHPQGTLDGYVIVLCV